MLVGERMTRNPVTILETASIDDGIHLMRERKVRRLPVLDSSGKMVGIVSIRTCSMRPLLLPPR
jgi:acetoin utilization protein AcuB